VYGKDSSGGTSIAGWVKRYDSKLLALYAQANMPDKYGTKRSEVKQETSVTANVKQELSLEQLSPESRADLRRILEREVKSGDSEGQPEAEAE